MPTGYTADIAKGITFPEFALSCARAFGACVTMRDDPQDTPIPEKFEPNDWHVKELAKARKKLVYLDGISIEEATELARTEYRNESQRITKRIREDRKLMSQYRDMLAQVRAWNPPSSDHVEFKNFMIQQIASSIKFDGMEDYYKEHPAVLLTGEQWLLKERGDAERHIAYHTKENQEEMERVVGRNKWIKELRESLSVLTGTGA